MATAKARSATTTATGQGISWQQAIMRLLPAWILLAMVLSILLPNVMTATFGPVGQALSGSTTFVEAVFDGSYVAAPVPVSSIAPLFTAEVDYWADDIARWAAQYGLDPNLMATVMQIESCGLAEVSSHAGAQGLFQVMPFHFAPGEIYTDPNTNAMRSANFLNECLGYANGDIGLTLACYNGGPSVTTRPYQNWHSETQRYYNWGLGIYNDAKANAQSSATLDSWLGAGGSHLCNSAAATQTAR